MSHYSEDVEYFNLTVHTDTDDEYYSYTLVNRYQDEGKNMDEQSEDWN